MMILILLILSLYLDGIICNNIYSNSFFMPLLTVITVYAIYPIYKKQEKKYFKIIMFLGIIYDLIYTNLFLFTAIEFLVIGIISKYIYKNYSHNIYKEIIYIIIVILCYELLTASILVIYKIVPVTISKVLNKIIHSLILNIIYGESLYFFIKKQA